METRNIAFDVDEVMVAFRQGDRQAFLTLFYETRDKLHNFMLGIVKVQSDAEDIVANCYYKLYHKRESMESRVHIRRWLFVTGRNEAISLLKKRVAVRQNAGQISYLMTPEENLHAEKAKILEQNERRLELRRKIDELPEQRRNVLIKYFYEDKTTSEIAEELKISNQTVLNHKTKAIDSLKEGGWQWPFEQ